MVPGLDVMTEMFKPVAVVSDDSIVASHPYASQAVLTYGVDVSSGLLYRQGFEIYVAAQQCRENAE